MLSSRSRNSAFTLMQLSRMKHYGGAQVAGMGFAAGFAAKQPRGNSKQCTLMTTDPQCG